MSDKFRDFLRELSKLTRKHEIVIGGCGCCGSPFVSSRRGLKATDKYTVDERGDNLTFTADSE